MPKSTEANNNFPYYGLDPAEFPYYEEMLTSVVEGASHFAPELMDLIARYSAMRMEWSSVIEEYAGLDPENYHLYEVINSRSAEDIGHFHPEVLNAAQIYARYLVLQEHFQHDEGNSSEQENAVVGCNGWSWGILDGISFSALSDSVRSVGEFVGLDSTSLFALSDLIAPDNGLNDAVKDGELDHLYNAPPTNAETPEDNEIGKTSKDQQNVPESFETQAADPESSACATVVCTGCAEGPMGREFLAE